MRGGDYTRRPPEPANYRTNTMTALLDEQNLVPFPSLKALTSGETAINPGSPDSLDTLPDGWQRLSTGSHGAHLYRVEPPGGGTVFWLAEMALNGEVQRRYCASEFHARWWLAVADEPRDTPNIFDTEERNERLRASFARGG